jgi:hypothetical protein
MLFAWILCAAMALLVMQVAPTRQYFRAVVLVDTIVHITTAEASILADTADGMRVLARASRLEVRTPDSLEVLLDSEGGARAVGPGLDCFVGARAVHKDTLPYSPLAAVVGRKPAPACVTVWPDVNRSGRGLKVSARAPRLSVRMARQSKTEWELLFICDRGFPRVDVRRRANDPGFFIRASDSLEGVTYVRFDSAGSVALYDNGREVGGLPPLQGKLVRAGGWWLVKNAVADVRNGDVAGVRFNPDSISKTRLRLLTDRAATRLSVDASSCSVRVYSPLRREPTEFPSRVRLEVKGRLNVSGSVTRKGLRVEVTGIAESATFRMLPQEPRWSEGRWTDTLPVGGPEQLLPSVLELYQYRSFAFLALLGALLTLVGFVWDKILKVDQSG